MVQSVETTPFSEDDAMQAGSMVYAGKYSAPDYETILENGCDLAIENTMIYHTPEVVEQLQSLGIPVLVERSSYESEPLGRMEWLKLYGALVGKADEACAQYDAILQQLDGVLDQTPTGKRVAFFYITTSGSVNVRKSADYIAKAIRMAGGDYVAFDESGEDALRPRGERSGGDACRRRDRLRRAGHRVARAAFEG